MPTSGLPIRLTIRRAVAALVATVLGTAGLVVIAAPAAATAGEGPIRVHIVRDYDGNGSQGALEVEGVDGLTVTLEDAAGARVPALRIGGGVYELDPTTLSGGTYRVRTEIPASLDYLLAAPAGGHNGSEASFDPLVTYVSAQPAVATEVLQAVWNPFDFVSAEGYRLAIGEQNSFLRRQSTSIVSYDPTTVPKTQIQRLTDISQTGSTSGVAWDRFGEQMFVGSAVKRHTLFGPGGSGAIYRVADGDAPVVWATLDAGPAVHEANLDEDFAIFGAVGKQGLGDLQTSEDGNSLYVVNLFDRKLSKYDTSDPASGTLLGSWDIPVPARLDGRSNDWRPYALGIRDGVLYVGGVDSAESVDGTDAERRAALHAYVWTFDESAAAFGAEPVLEQPLDFLRGQVYTGIASDPLADAKDNHWNGWRSTWDTFETFSAPDDSLATRSLRGPQPLLADIVVDNDGSLILGFKDRTADQFGLNAPVPDPANPELVQAMAGGDINRACRTRAGTYIWEGSDPVLCPNNALGLTGNPEVETYFRDASGTGGVHREAAKGPLFMVPSEPWVGLFYTESGTATSPVSTRWLDRTTGANYALDTAAIATGGWGKGNGIGGVALIADAAIPAQLGNRTWFDANRDGLQTPGEPDLPGVTVHLIDDAGVVQQETTTDDRGYYYFNVEQDRDWRVEFDYSTADITGLGAYGVRTVDDLEWTTPNAAGSGGVIDNQIQSRTETTSGTVAQSPVTRLAPGGVDHTLDAGVRVITGSFSLRKVVDGPAALNKAFTIAWSIGGVPQEPFVVRADDGVPPLLPHEVFVSGQLPIGSVIELHEETPIGGLAPNDMWADPAFEVNGVGTGTSATFPITQDRDRPAVGVVLTNPVIERGRFAIQKVVESPVPLDGGAEFTVDVTIGNGGAFAEQISVDNGYTSDLLPVGTRVTVCEHDATVELPHGYEWTQTPVLRGPNGEAPREDGCVEFPVGGAAVAGVVLVTNTVAQMQAGFTLTKTVSGDDGDHAGQFLVDWAVQDAAGDFVTQPDPIPVGVGAPWSSALLPVGTVIQLTERSPSEDGLPVDSEWGPARFSGEGVSPDGTFEIGANGVINLDVGIANLVLDRGRFTVSKSLSEDAQNGVRSGTRFTIEYRIGDDPTVFTDTIAVNDPFVSEALDLDTVVRVRELPAVRDFEDGWEASWDPARYISTVDFTREAAASGPDWIVFPIQDGTAAGLIVDNPARLLMGTFELTKRVSGAADDSLDVGFTVNYRAEHVAFPGGVREGTLQVRPGQRVRGDQFPVGARVTLTEAAPAGLPAGLQWAGGTFVDDDGNPLVQPIVIREDDEGGPALEFELRNRFERPQVDIEKGDDGFEGDGHSFVNDADTMGDGQYYEPGESRTIVFESTNRGTEPLLNVVVTDRTTAGGASLESLECTFPGTDAAGNPRPFVVDGVQLGDGSWRVPWAESGSNRPADQRQQWDPGVAFPCTATLIGIDVHADLAAVSGTGAASGVPVRDEDHYNAFTASLQIIKYDGERPDPAITSGDLAIIPAKELKEVSQDANDPEHAVTYPANREQAVRWVVTNTSTATWLTDVDLADHTDYGPQIGDWTCDLRSIRDRDGSPGPAQWSFIDDGTFDGLWAPHVSFFCEGPLTLDLEQTHGDTVRVDASVVVPEEPSGTPAPKVVHGVPALALDHNGDVTRLSDIDPFHVRTPGAPLAMTGANPLWPALIGALLLLLGFGGIVFAARVRRTMGRRG